MIFQTHAYHSLQDALDEELTIRLGSGAEYFVASQYITPATVDTLLNRHFGHTGDTVVVMAGDRSVSFSENIRNAVNHALPPDLTIIDSIYHSRIQREYPGAQISIELVNAADTAVIIHTIRSHVTPAIFIDGLSGKAIRAVIVEPQRILFRKIIVSIALSALFVILAFICTGYQLHAAYLQKKTNIFILDYLHYIIRQLKSPVAVLSNVMEYAGSELVHVDPAWTQQVYLSNRSIGKITGMIDSTLRFSVAGKARMPLYIQCFNLKEAILQVMEELRFKWVAAFPVVTVTDDIEHPAIVADRLHLCDAISNLVDNAVKHSPAGITVAIHLSVKRKYIRIAVKDTGSGIPQKETRRTFERFYQGSHSSGVQGHGLGLSYVQMVCKAHGGRVKAYSTAGKGNEFVIWIPVRKPTRTLSLSSGHDILFRSGSWGRTRSFSG